MIRRPAHRNFGVLVSSGAVLPPLAILLSLLVGGWFVTYGDGAFLADKRLVFSEFFDAQGDALLQGHLDVPCNVIGWERFEVNGLCYGYFGVTPSLFRIFFNFWLPEYRGNWASLSMIAASAGLLISAYGCTTVLRKILFPTCSSYRQFNVLRTLFLLGLGLGSTNIFLLSRPVLYHEVIIWSVTLSLCALLFMLLYWSDGKVKFLLGAGLCAGLAVHARPLAGFASIAACALLPILRTWRESTAPRRYNMKNYLCRLDVLAGSFVALLALTTYLAVTYGKFGSLDGMPVRYSVQYDSERLARLNGSMFHLSNIFWNIESYFGMTGITPKFLFLSDGVPNLDRIELQSQYPEAFIDDVEPYMSLPVAFSALLVFASAGMFGTLRQGVRGTGVLVLTACSLLGPVLLLFFSYLSYRYFHEYLLWGSMAGAAGVCYMSRSKFMPWIMAVLVAVNIIVNVDFALRYQLNNTNVGAAIPEVIQRIAQWKTFLSSKSQNSVQSDIVKKNII